MTNLERQAASYIEKNNLLMPTDRILVACSGGVDSIVLLHYLNELKKTANFDIAAVHVNHMLRGQAADGDRQFVERFCAEHAIQIFAANIEIPAIHAEEKGNLQDVCRRERYKYFMEIMIEEGFNKVAVAHHADDQIESILMALVRGSHEQGVLGMPAQRDFYGQQLIRPFLSVTRQDIMDYLTNYQLDYREDASNKKDSYTRNRLRHHVVPLLREENSKIAVAFQRFSEKERMEEVVLEDLTKAVFNELIVVESDNMMTLSIIPFQKQPLALQRRVILLLLKYLYKDTIIAQSYTLWTAILQLTTTIDGHKELSLPDGGVAQRQYDVLYVYRRRPLLKEVEQHVLAMDRWYLLPNGQRYGIFHDMTTQTYSDEAKFYALSHPKLKHPLTRRSKNDGDRMQLAGMGNYKKVSRIFIDAKVPLQDRIEWPLIVDSNDEIIALPGLRVSSLCTQVHSSSKGAIMIVDVQI
ncbi:tRNA lysidine(34) synthetase TilS [Kurthia sibirica]|uniref:tRNA(Ile)-lysidine synthase n=1 Tax=Kurthia sibirica TaxID=202750 RepID=A0A2U3AI99_9BACL|nr:tRNA lysidine(34) synthetase TilS [Kurthia sibirica]PWI24268.1 tRNA lysidine(34) synthetase TilS [Kurthia sibirica]GEK34498.1 tRNA(Ile)-lysidine synthase [Kurthia sibirica]